MRRVLLAASLWLGLVGCGSRGHGGGNPHDSCTGPGTCAVGNYCARTDDGDVCWPDTVAPVIRGVTVECSTIPCRRDSSLLVTATVEDESATGRAWVELDVDPGTRWEMAAVSGSSYLAEIPLDRGPFPYFEHDVHPVVQAIDEAGNPASTQSGLPLRVTRAKWTLSLKTSSALSLSAPAVLPDGRIVLGGSDGRLYFAASDGQSSTSVQVGTEAFSGPPSVGSDAIWVASQDGLLHELLHDGTIVDLPENCSAPGSLVGPPAVSGQRAVVGSTGSVLIAATSQRFCDRLPAVGEVSSPVVITAAGHALVAAAGRLKSFSLTGSGDLLEDWTGSPSAPALPDTVRSAPALDGDSALWTVGQGGTVSRTTTTDATLAALGGVSVNSAGVVILADGSAVVSDSAKYLKRMVAAGMLPWTQSESLTGAPATALVLGGIHASILVPTGQGMAYAINPTDGHVLWSVDLSAQSLQPANVTPNPGNRTSTAYLAGADGKLYAIIVDGVLDTSAPWPKAFHDVRNTSNAGELP
jgi:outer membrane protein assembly factor BamB